MSALGHQWALGWFSGCPLSARSGLRAVLTVPRLAAFHLGYRCSRLRNKGMDLSSYGLAGMVPVQDWGHLQSKTAHRSPHNLRTTDTFSLTWTDTSRPEAVFVVRNCYSSKGR